MEPFSTLTGLVQVLDFTAKLIDFGRSVYLAAREHRDEVAKLSMLTSLLPSIQARLDEAIKHRNTASDASPDLETWEDRLIAHLDPTSNPSSPVRRLIAITERLQKDMAAWDASGRSSRLRETFMRHFKRADIEKRFDDLLDCWQLIDHVLAGAQLDLARDTNTMQSRGLAVAERGLALQVKQGAQLSDVSEVVQETLLMQNAVVDLSHEHMAALQEQTDRVARVEGFFAGISDRLSKQDEERKREQEERIRSDVLRWLSPLDFVAFQDQTFGRTYPTGQWLLDSREFRAWSDGRPWHLRCHGDTGAGKVCILSFVLCETCVCVIDVKCPEN